jgi:hypothetical protein
MYNYQMIDRPKENIILPLKRQYYKSFFKSKIITLLLQSIINKNISTMKTLHILAFFLSRLIITQAHP